MEFEYRPQSNKSLQWGVTDANQIEIKLFGLSYQISYTYAHCMKCCYKIEFITAWRKTKDLPVNWVDNGLVIRAYAWYFAHLELQNSVPCQIHRQPTANRFEKGDKLVNNMDHHDYLITIPKLY